MKFWTTFAIMIGLALGFGVGFELGKTRGAEAEKFRSDWCAVMGNTAKGCP